MHRNLARLCFGVFLSVLILFLFPAWGFSETKEELEGKIQDHSKNIEAIEKEIEKYEKELTVISGNKRTLENAVKELDVSRKKITATISAEERKISKNEIEIKELDADISTTQQEIKTTENTIGETLRRINLIENDTMVEHFLRADSFEFVWEDIDTTGQFQMALKEKVDDLTGSKTQLEQAHASSTEKQKELLRRKKGLVGQKQGLEIAKTEKSFILSKTKKQEAEYQKLLEEKRAAKIAFENALNELESQLAFTIDPNRIPPAGKGVLRYPLASVSITQKFGNTDFAKSGAYNGKGHNGVDFRASIGTPVLASLSGTVEGTGNTDQIAGCYSYGKWVLIRHGNGLSTLYAHLSSILVQVGEKVETGETIGLSGNTGYSTGPHLHFSVYVSEATQIRKLGEMKAKTKCARASIPVAPLEAYLNPLEYL